MAFLFSGCGNQPAQTDPAYDLLVYGATPAGIMAAVTAADHGLTVQLVAPHPVVGGMYTSGLNTAESEHMINDVITGRTRDFFIELRKRYYDSAYFQTFGNGRGLDFKPGDPAFFFESRHALALFNDMLRNAGVTVITGKPFATARTEDTRLLAITTTDSSNYAARYFIDASYEGDLMAAAGVSYTYGREPKATYREHLAGLRLVDDTLYARTTDSTGKLLSYFNQYDQLEEGSGDDRVMNYNFRPTMSEDSANSLPIYRPANYDSTDYDFLADYLVSEPETHIWDLIGVYRRGNNKFEFNNQQRALVSLGMFGANQGYTDGTHEQRQAIYNRHKKWTLGFLYFLAYDERVPEPLQQEARRYGYARDEFTDNNHFPYQLYVREGRRMVGPYVMSEKDIFRDREKDDAILLGSHWVDSHHVQRIALTDSSFVNEGRIWEMVLLPFEVPYRSITPKASECSNMLVPVSASFSHVAFCSYRLESTWMQAGHAAALAIVQAAGENRAVQDINVKELQDQLQKEGMLLQQEKMTGYTDYLWLQNQPERIPRYTRMYGLYGVDIPFLKEEVSH